jgi:hypothetical protein
MSTAADSKDKEDSKASNPSKAAEEAAAAAYTVDLAASLKSFVSAPRAQELYGDVAFLVGKGKENSELITSFKLLLSSSSPVFEGLCYNYFQPGKPIDCLSQPILLPDISPDIFKYLLANIYSNYSLQFFDPNRVDLLLEAAKKFQMHQLISKCENYIGHGCSLENCIEWLTRSQADSIRKRAALALIEDNFSKLCKKHPETLTNLAAEDIELIVKSNFLRAPEVDIYDFTLKWAAEECKRNKLEPNQANQRTVLHKILPHIRFPLLKMQHLAEKLAPLALLPQEHLLQLYTYAAQPNKSLFNYTLPYEKAPRKPRKGFNMFKWKPMPNEFYSSAAPTLLPTFTDSDGKDGEEKSVCTYNGTSWVMLVGDTVLEKNSGVMEWECTLEKYDTTNSYNATFGIVPDTKDMVGTKINSLAGYSTAPGYSYVTGQRGVVYNDLVNAQFDKTSHQSNNTGTVADANGPTIKQGDRIGLQLDTDAHTLQFFVNGVRVGRKYTGLEGRYLPTMSLIQHQKIVTNFDVNFEEK